MKVLIGVATFPVTAETPYEVRAETRESIDALMWVDDGHEATLVHYGNDDPAKAPTDNLTDKHNRMRAAALDFGYDALLTVEADVIIPPDALAQLAAVDADVVYGTYASRTNPMVLTMPTINGYKGRSISADPEQWRDKFGTVIPCEGVGFGCTLIRRNVLEAVEFRRDVSSQMRRKFDDDWTFALDVKAAGFKSAAHLGVLCGHIQRNGLVRWVDADAPTFVRVEGEARATGAPPAVGTYRVRRTLFGPVNTYAPGAMIELNAADAAILLAANKIESLGD